MRDKRVMVLPVPEGISRTQWPPTSSVFFTSNIYCHPSIVVVQRSSNTTNLDLLRVDSFVGEEYRKTTIQTMRLQTNAASRKHRISLTPRRTSWCWYWSDRGDKQPQSTLLSPVRFTQVIGRRSHLGTAVPGHQQVRRRR